MRLSRFMQSLAYRNLRRFGVAHTWNFAAVSDISPGEQRGAVTVSVLILGMPGLRST